MHKVLAEWHVPGIFYSSFQEGGAGAGLYCYRFCNVYLVKNTDLSFKIHRMKARHMKPFSCCVASYFVVALLLDPVF